MNNSNTTGESRKTGRESPMKIQRIAAGMTQTDIAIRTGSPHSRINLIEAGAARPSRQAAQRIAEAIGCDVRACFPNFDSLVESTRMRTAGGVR